VDAETSTFVVGIAAGLLVALACIPKTDNSGTLTLAIVGTALVLAGLATIPEVAVVVKAVQQCPPGRAGEACAAAGAVFLLATKASGALLFGGAIGGGATAWYRSQKVTSATQNADASNRTPPPSGR
jgi:hypothetical protein